MSARPTVLVLGAGSNVTQGIQKALALGPTPWRVVAACVSPLSAGLHLAERAYVSPLAADPGFLDWVIETARAEEAVAVLSGVEPVIDALSAGAERVRAESGAVAVAAGDEQLAVGRDKLVTARWLEANGLPAPLTAPASDAVAVGALVAACGLPVIAKPRGGRGGAGVLLVEDERMLQLVLGRDDLVVQQHLGDEESEYTVGCLCDRDGRLHASVAFQRRLAAGTTVVARAGRFPAVQAAAEEIVCALRPAGPCNVQMRVHEGRPVAFELNVRFSGTTPMRARLGFPEVDATVRHLAFGEPLPPFPDALEGTVLRYHTEVYVHDERALEALAAGRAIDGPSGAAEAWGVTG